MNLRTVFRGTVLALGSLSFLHAIADTVVTDDGSTLVGTVQKIEEGIVYLDTAYAGTLEIEQDRIESLEVDNPVNIALESGTIARATLEATGKGLTVNEPTGQLQAEVADIEAIWPVGEDSPEVRRQKAAAEALRRTWRYNANASLAGKSGNSDEFATLAEFSATLKGPDDALQFYASVDSAERDGEQTSEEYIGGVDYSTRAYNDFGWYVRTELERDEFEDLDLRSTSAFGLLYDVFVQDNVHELQLRAGLSYLYEDYSVPGVPSLDNIGLEFAANYLRQLTDWLRVTSDWRFIPAFEDLGNFRASQSTAFEAPLGTSENWTIRFGVSNFFNSEPEGGNTELDTTYFTTLSLSWD